MRLTLMASRCSMGKRPACASGATEEEILNLCQRHCRSDHFILIDEFKAITDTFMLGAAMSAESNRDSAHGYRIFKKHS